MSRIRPLRPDPDSSDRSVAPDALLRQEPADEGDEGEGEEEGDDRKEEDEDDDNDAGYSE